MEKTYELYHYLMRLPVELTHIQEMRLDEARNKYLPTEEELNPNMKFVNNRLVAALAGNEQLQQYAQEHTVTWNDDPIFLRLLLDKVLRSDLYNDYMADDEDSMTADCLESAESADEIKCPKRRSAGKVDDLEEETEKTTYTK